jgi:hypothetical protein
VSDDVTDPPWEISYPEEAFRMGGDGQRRQCCPMDTYDTDSAGNLRAVCTCGDDCACTCLDCICPSESDDWPEYETP